MDNGEYKDIYEFAYDMRLVWRNCCTFNQEGSEIYDLGKKLSDVFEERFAKVEELSMFSFWFLISSSCRSTVSFLSCVLFYREPDVATKRSFVDNLFKLTPEDLAKVVETLNERCESALDKVFCIFCIHSSLILKWLILL